MTRTFRISYLAYFFAGACVALCYHSIFIIHWQQAGMDGTLVGTNLNDANDKQTLSEFLGQKPRFEISDNTDTHTQLHVRTYDDTRKDDVLIPLPNTQNKKPETAKDAAIRTKNDSGAAVTNATTNSKPVRKWAYAFLVGGCSREDSYHRGFIANIAVSARQLYESKSQADVVVYIQMSVKSKYDTLSEQETNLLQANPNVKIKYLPKFSSETHEMFYSLMMEKFIVLNMTEYSRVLFLDSDVMLLASLDYMFELSEPEISTSPEGGLSDTNTDAPILMENVIISWINEPCHGGFFMLKPDHDDYLRAQEIIHQTEVAALEQAWPHFDEELGFGHKIGLEDPWIGSTHYHERVTGTNWTWHGAFADQGFLYHWVKYEKKNVSIINGYRIDNYSEDSLTGKILKNTLYNKGKDGILNRYSANFGDKNLKLGIYGPNVAPLIDFKHFIGRTKPWYKINGVSREKLMKDRSSMYGRIWFSNLDKVEKSAGLPETEFPTNNKQGGRNPVGAFPVYSQRINHIRLKAENNWTMYEN